MSPLARAAYACALAGMLLPAMASKLRRDGHGALRACQRLACSSPADARGGIWLNFASVGELNAIANLARKLQTGSSKLPLFATCSSEAAYAMAPGRLGVKAQILPLDFATVMGRMFKRVSPKICVLAEQELWPNMIGQARKNNVPVVVVNGRLGARTARRHARLLMLSKDLFASLTLVCAADRASARRFRLLGAPNVVVTGNMKFDQEPDAKKIAQGTALKMGLQAAASKPIVLLASTRANSNNSEEAMLLDALADKLPDISLIVVPRHPHRHGEVAAMMEKRKIAFARYSAHDEDQQLPGCVLGDTMGQMEVYMEAADVVFIGASLINQGGQNPMEAFALGKPVVCGPHTDNFAELVNAAINAGAATIASDASEAAAKLARLAKDEDARRQMGEHARKLAASYKGATERTLNKLEPLLVNVRTSGSQTTPS